MRKRKQTQFSLSEDTNSKINFIGKLLSKKSNEEFKKANRSKIVESAINMLYDFLIKNKELG
jgi:hypothetical protein